MDTTNEQPLADHKAERRAKSEFEIRLAKTIASPLGLLVLFPALSKHFSVASTSKETT